MSSIFSATSRKHAISGLFHRASREKETLKRTTDAVEATRICRAQRQAVITGIGETIEKIDVRKVYETMKKAGSDPVHIALAAHSEFPKVIVEDIRRVVGNDYFIDPQNAPRIKVSSGENVKIKPISIENFFDLVRQTQPFLDFESKLKEASVYVTLQNMRIDYDNYATINCGPVYMIMSVSSQPIKDPIVTGEDFRDADSVDIPEGIRVLFPEEVGAPVRSKRLETTRSPQLEPVG